MSNQVNSMNKGLTVKDLVTTGIFTALLFVFCIGGRCLFCNKSCTNFFHASRRWAACWPHLSFADCKKYISVGAFL